MLERAQASVDKLLNSEGRSAGHVAAGAALCVGAALLSALIAARRSPTSANPELEREYDALDKSPLEPPKFTYSLLWPALFSAVTLSALRIWNAPAGPERTRALGLWGALQGVNALWMALGPRHRLAQLIAAVSTAGVTLAYANEAQKVDAKAARMVSPYAHMVGFANLVSEELWRKNRKSPPVTIH